MGVSYEHVLDFGALVVIATRNFQNRTKTQYFRIKNPRNPGNADNTPKRLRDIEWPFELQCMGVATTEHPQRARPTVSGTHFLPRNLVNCLSVRPSVCDNRA